MRIDYILFPFYLVLSFWAIPKFAFFRKSGLSSFETRLLFSFKMFFAITSAWLFQRMSNNSDYLTYNNEGKIQYELLLSNPRSFFDDLTSYIRLYGLRDIFASENSFWGYLRFNLLFKFIALLNLLTGGNFYLNSMIFSSLVFLGHLSLYKIFSNIYKGHKVINIFACFCLPSMVLYTSCIHKDGIVFLCVAVVGYVFYQFISTSNSMRLKHILALLVSLVLIFLFRNYVLVALIPALFVAILCKYLPHRNLFICLGTYSIFSFAFFFSGSISSSLNLPAAVIQRKADFAALAKGNTDIAMNELKPTVQSFLINLPQAINHTFFRPYLWEFPQFSVMLTALELFFYQVLLLIFLFYRKKPVGPIHPFNIFGLALLFNMALIIGYTIPNIGAIVRYRSIFWIFLIAPVLCNIDFKRLPFLRRLKVSLD